MNTENARVIHFQDCRLDVGISGKDRVVFTLQDFHASKGDLWALTGPSGCGKSTLLNLASGLLLPSQGKVEVLGQDIASMSNYKRDLFRGKNTGFIYQSFNLLEGFSAIENVLIGMRFGRGISSKERKERAETVLNEVGLEHRIHQKPSRLSVGERQRVAIARAIANRPAILLADEPTGALDPRTGSDIFELLLTICREENCTLLMVTHDLELAAKLPHQFDCRHLVSHQPLKEAAA